MTAKSDAQLAAILARLALTRSGDEEEGIARGELASWLFHASANDVEHLLRKAGRDNRLRRCLSAARYYSGLSQEKCKQIDDILSAPFPAAQRKKR